MPRIQRLRALLGNRVGFLIIVLLLILQSLWIALTARYPQAFDEQFHFGLIQLHAHNWLPFFSHQPAGADAYGAAVRDPSYLYHYLMSFPYRLIQLFTHDVTIQVIILRLLNVGLFCSALPLFKKIALRLGLSSAASNGVLLIFVLLPVTSLLASQINYYNLLVPLTAWLTLLLLQFQSQAQTTKIVPVGTVWKLALVCLLGSIVHYPFLPLAAIACLYVVVVSWRRRLKIPRLQWNIQLMAAGLLLLLSLGLFSERYGINLVRYHTPTPECDQVLSVQACRQYSPWLRNYYFAAQNDAPTQHEILTFPFAWLDRVVDETTFVIGSGFNSGINVSNYQYGNVDYWTGSPLPVPRLLTFGVLITGLLAIIVTARKLWANRPLRLVWLLTAGLTAALFLLNFSDFLHVGDIVGVHGRYLVPVMPFLLMAIAVAYRQLWQSRWWPRIFAVVTVIFVLQGGGLVTYWVRNEPRWFWPQSQPAQQVNLTAQRLLKPIILGD